MLKGRFGNTSGAPYVEGHIVFPRLKTKGNVSILVDTGADNGVVMPADARRLGIDFSPLRNPHETIGLGGGVETYAEQALITFADSRSTYTYNVKIDFAKPNPDLERTPSLLGRDVLNRWRMIHDPSNSSLSFKVISADLTSSVW